MFSYVEAHNFLSFGNVSFDLRATKTRAKDFVALYGENGSGKTNIVTLFYLLSKSLHSLQSIKDDEEFSELINASKNNIPVDVIEEVIRMRRFDSFLASCRTIDSKEPTTIKYGFLINKIEGYYEIGFTDHLVSEKLYYLGDKSRTTLYSISENSENIDCNFSPAFIHDLQYKKELKEAINKYWGKHTLFAIIDNEFSQKNKKYIFEQINSHYFDVARLFSKLTIVCKTSIHSAKGTTVKRFNSVLNDLAFGEIEEKELYKIKLTESILNDFFTQAYADIKKVKYKLTENKNKITYSLQFHKMIAGDIRIIDYRHESAGTQSVLSIFEALIGAVFDGIVIYDEIDDGIHDLLLNCILESLFPHITGQLIITTHNTLLLERISPSHAYVINTDYTGEKEIDCLSDFGIKENDNHNARLMYLKGAFGGTPFVDYIDFSKIIHELKESKKGNAHE